MGESKVHKREQARGQKATDNCPSVRVVPQVFEVVIECRHEAEQRAVYERMCGEGFRCRVMVL
jgi:hypothetical protein